MSTNSILSGIAKDCSNMGASIGANKDLILINYLDFNKPLTLSALNRQLNDDFNNKGGLTDIKLFTGAKQYIFEGTDYSVVPSVSAETKEDGNTWYSHSISFTVYNKSAEARATLLSLGKARVIAVTRDRSTGLYELFGAEQGLKLSGLDRPYSGSQSSNFYSISIATPDIAVIKERSIGELSLKLDGVGGGGGEVIPPSDNLEYLLSLKEDKINKGKPNGYTPLDENTKIPAGFLNIVNDLTTGGATNLLSAEQGKAISDRLSIGLNNIKSERVIALNAPITRSKASQAINNLPSFVVSDNEIPYFVTTTLEGEQGYKVELLGLGRGTYGQGGLSIAESQVRISTLVDSGLAGINEILFLGNTAREKTLFFKYEGIENTYTSIATGSIDIVNGGKASKLFESALQFTDIGRFGSSSLLPPTRVAFQNTTNNLPSKSGILALSVNGVFADLNGNINITGGGALPSLQQVLEVGSIGSITKDFSLETHSLDGGVDKSSIYMKTGVTNKSTESMILATNAKLSLSSSHFSINSVDNFGSFLIDNTGVFLNGNNTSLNLSGGAGGINIKGGAVGVSIDGQGGAVDINGFETNFTGGQVTFNNVVQHNNSVNIKSHISFYDSINPITEIAKLVSERILEGSTPINVLQTSGNFRTNGVLYLQNELKFESIHEGQTYFTKFATQNITASSSIKLPTGIKGDFTIISNVNGIFADVDGTLTLPIPSGNAFDIDDTLQAGNTATNKNLIFKGATSDPTLTINNQSINFSLASGDTGSFNIDGISFLNDTSHFEGSIGVGGIVLNQNPLNPNFKTTLSAQYNDESDKELSLPNMNGTLLVSVNGVFADENGNVVVSGGGGSQNLDQTLLIGNTTSRSILMQESSTSLSLKGSGILVSDTNSGSGTDVKFYGVSGYNFISSDNQKINTLFLTDREEEGTAQYSFDPNKEAGSYVIATMSDIVGGSQDLSSVLGFGGEAYLENGLNTTDVIFTVTENDSTIVLSSSKNSDVSTLTIENGVFSVRNKQTGFGYNTLKFASSNNPSSSNVNILIPSPSIAGDYVLSTTNELLPKMNTASANTALATGGTKALTVDSTGMPVVNDIQGITVNSATLVSGVINISISGVSATSLCTSVNISTPSGTTGIMYKGVCSSGILTISSINTSGAIVTTDNSTVNFMVVL